MLETYRFQKRVIKTLASHIREKRAIEQINNAEMKEFQIPKQPIEETEAINTFKETLSKLMGTASPAFTNSKLKSSWLDTPLGTMLAISDDDALYFLDFADRHNLPRRVNALKEKTKSAIYPGVTEPLKSLEKELKEYFEGKLTEFKTPILLAGTKFQKQAWEALIEVPYGETRTYTDQANVLGKPSAMRAVGTANGANPINILVPCHRLINSQGGLSDYGGGKHRKRWLLDHEKKFKL